MKLIYCPKCFDLVRTVITERRCHCGAASGRYVTQTVVMVRGTAIPVGINNQTLSVASTSEEIRTATTGVELSAYVIPWSAKNVLRGYYVPSHTGATGEIMMEPLKLLLQALFDRIDQFQVLHAMSADNKEPFIYEVEKDEIRLDGDDDPMPPAFWRRLRLAYPHMSINENDKSFVLTHTPGQIIDPA